MDPSKAWLVVGFLGQACFSARFVVQWIASERRRESVVPVYFWYFSVAGGVILLAYAIHRLDPVFILGQAAGLVIYVRNLYLIARRRQVPPHGDGSSRFPPMR
ncbi:MAG: lipid-A-disaccharide synthase N-terminal domain-containing protein [Candidatus Rokuibacteriota bacterium]